MMDSAGDPTRAWLKQNRVFQDVESKNYLAGNSINWYDRNNAKQVLETILIQAYLEEMGGFKLLLVLLDVPSYERNLWMEKKFEGLRSRLNLDAKITRLAYFWRNEYSICLSVMKVYSSRPWTN